jgi:transcriptional regulator
MLIRPHDACSDDDRWRTFVASQGFGHFAVSGRESVPCVVPTQFVLTEHEVLFHLARPNPVFAALAHAPSGVMSVAGDWAYIPGAWKTVGDEDPSLGIPTTYYAAVQLAGRVTVTDDRDEVAMILRTQLADVEPDGGLQDPGVHVRQFPAIRGIRLSIDDVRAKFKYGGNVDEVHREAVIAHLTERNGPGDRAAAARVPRSSPDTDSTPNAGGSGGTHGS